MISSDWGVALAEVVGRVDQHPVPRDPERDRPLGERGGHLYRVSHHVGVVAALGQAAGFGPSGMRADQAHVVLGGDLGQAAVPAAPGVVEDVGPRPTHLARHLRAPGVHADHEIRQLGSAPGNEAGRPADLLGDVDVVAEPGLDATDVHQVGPLGDDLVHPLHRGRLVPRRPAVVERVGRAVDDGHHEHRSVGIPVPSQPQAHRSRTPSRSPPPRMAPRRMPEQPDRPDDRSMGGPARLGAMTPYASTAHVELTGAGHVVHRAGTLDTEPVGR